MFAAAVQFLTRIPLSSETLPRGRRAGAQPGFFSARRSFDRSLHGGGGGSWSLGLAAVAGRPPCLGFRGRSHGRLSRGWPSPTFATLSEVAGRAIKRSPSSKTAGLARSVPWGCWWLFSLRAGAMMTLIDQWGVVGWPIWCSAFVASSALGRYVMVLAMALVPPVAGRESLARAVGSTLSRWVLVASSVWVFLATAPFVVLLPVQSLVAVLMLFAAVLGLLLVVRRRLGGYHGRLPWLYRLYRPNRRITGGRRKETTMGPAFLKSSLILVRHGPVADRYHGLCYGRSDVELSPRGEGRSRELAETLAALPVDRIMHSGLGRTCYLARHLGQRLGMPACRAEALCERDFGRWELRSWDDLYREYGEAILKMVSEPGAFRPGGGKRRTRCGIGYWTGFEAFRGMG